MKISCDRHENCSRKERNESGHFSMNLTKHGRMVRKFFRRLLPCVGWLTINLFESFPRRGSTGVQGDQVKVVALVLRWTGTMDPTDDFSCGMVAFPFNPHAFAAIPAVVFGDLAVEQRGRERVLLVEFEPSREGRMFRLCLCKCILFSARLKNNIEPVSRWRSRRSML